MMAKNYTYLLSLVTKEQLPLFYTEDLSMDGCITISTLDATTEVHPSPFSISKMGTASEATPTLSGHIKRRRLLIILPCCSTSPNKGTSHTCNKQSMQQHATFSVDQSSLETVQMSYVHSMNHLTVIIAAHHKQNNLVIIFLTKKERTCSLIRRMDTSQFKSQKSGKSNTLTDHREQSQRKIEIKRGLQC